MSLVAELVAALLAASIAVDGARKLYNADAFVRWLSSGGLGRLARRDVVYLLGALEIGLGAASVWAPGRLVAIVGVVLVTPLGAVLVRRTGVCACRGVVRSRSPLDLVVRNAIVVLLGLGSLLWLDAAVRLPVVLVVVAGWIALEVYSFLVLWRAPIRYRAPADHPLRVGADA